EVGQGDPFAVDAEVMVDRRQEVVRPDPSLHHVLPLLVGWFGGEAWNHSALKTSAATRSPERTAPSMYPHQTSDVSVPAQWTRPTGSRRALPYCPRTPTGSGETHPAVHASADQSISK